MACMMLAGRPAIQLHRWRWLGRDLVRRQRFQSPRRSATVDVRPAAPTGPRAAHHSAYVAPAVGPSAVLGFGRTKSRYRSITEEHPAGGQLWPEVLSRPVVVAIHEDASRTSPAPETSSDHQGHCAWTHRSSPPVPVVLERASLPSSPRRAARVLCASLPSRCSPISPFDYRVYRGAAGLSRTAGSTWCPHADAPGPVRCYV